MKSLTKLILAASLLSVGFAGTASAVTPANVIRITGSSAYRAAVCEAIVNLLNTPTASYYNYNASPPAAASSLTGANQQLFTGTLKSKLGTIAAGSTVYFQCSWSGSLSGLINLTQNSNTNYTFLATTNPTSTVTASATSGPSGGEALGNGVNPAPVAATAQTADVAFSDVFQTSTPYNNPSLATANAGGDGSLPGVVGVVPFVLVSNPDAGTKITNMNPNQVAQLYAGGLALSQITGNGAADSATLVLPVGRDEDSGTRFTTFAETGFSFVPLQDFGVPTQYAVTSTGTSSPTVTVDPYPAETLFGSSKAAGTEGYSSGGNEQTALNYSGTLNSDNPCVVVGYLGESDALKACVTDSVSSSTGTALAHFVSYNGVAYGNASAGTTIPTVFAAGRTALEQGQYTLWGYEHCYYRSGSGTASTGVTYANIDSVADALAQGIRSTDAIITGDLISNMQVGRAYEGGPVSYVGSQD